MTESVMNQDLLNRLKELDYFFDVLARAEKTAKDNGKNMLSNDDVKNVLAQDVNLYINSPKAANQQTDRLNADSALENRQRFQEAQKQVELNNELRPLLGLIAAVAPSLVTELENNNQPRPEMGLGNVRHASDVLTHPKLAPLLDTAASSFLDAYRKIHDAENKGKPKDKDADQDLDNALKNANKLNLQFKMMMQNSPKLKAEFENRLKMQPNYKPTIKPASPF